MTWPVNPLTSAASTFPLFPEHAEPLLVSRSLPLQVPLPSTDLSLTLSFSMTKCWLKCFFLKEAFFDHPFQSHTPLSLTFSHISLFLIPTQHIPHLTISQHVCTFILIPLFPVCHVSLTADSIHASTFFVFCCCFLLYSYDTNNAWHLVSTQQLFAE